MITTRGWAALGAAAALVLLYAGFGEPELFAGGVFLVGSVIAGALIVRRSRPDADLTRQITPLRLHEGDRARVEIRIHARRPLRPLIIEDEVSKLGRARFATARAARNTTVSAHYEIVCRPRGVYQIGPAELIISDPLDLAAVRATTGGVDRLVVYPAIEPLSGFPATRGHDPSVQSAHPSHAPSGGDDFFTLREYRQGDDLRRVHWPSSAKRDELMIRQLEIPWQSRALVLLDTRAKTHTPESFEHAVKGAASVLHHFFGGGYVPQLWVGDTVRPPGPAPYELAMEKLAAVQPMKALDLRHSVLRMRRHGHTGGALVLITGALDEENLAVYQTLGRDYSKTVLMVVSDEEPEFLVPFKLGGAAAAVVGLDDSWAGAWTEAIGAGRWSSASPG
jgi:uncharacterized protein (DUF58 family)